MRTKLLALAVFLCLFGIMKGQNLLTSKHESPVRQIYEVDAGLAEAFLSNPKLAKSETFYEQLVLSKRLEDKSPDDLAPGHYFETHVVENELNVRYIQQPAFSVFAESDGQNLIVKVLDFSGKSIEDAWVQVGEKSFFYDAKADGYRCAKSPRDGLLKVSNGKMTQYFHLQQEHRTTFRGKLKKSVIYPLYRWTLRPVWWTIRLPYDLTMLAFRRKRGWPGYVWYKFFYGYRNGYASKRRSKYHAFMLSNQPKYRPGDTVKVKAYVSKAHFKPSKEKYFLVFRDHDYKYKALGEMQQQHPGCYTFEFVIKEEMGIRLGQNLELFVAKKLKSKFRREDLFVEGIGNMRSVAKHNVMYEDYELKQFNFNIRAESNEHYEGKPAVLFLEATDMNKLTVPDARAKLYALSGSLSYSSTKPWFLPDTLWTWSGNLDAAGETRLEIPMDKFPDAEFGYTVHYECRSSDNELKTGQLSLSYIHDREKLEITRKGDSLEIHLRKGKDDLPAMGRLQFFGADANMPPYVQHLQLPAIVDFPANFTRIKVEAGHSEVSWSGALESGLFVDGLHSGDSILIEARTSDGTAFSYSIYQDKKEIAKGNTAELLFHQKAKHHADYHIVVHRVLNGASKLQRHSFHWYNKDLEVAWDGPETVFPGMKAQYSLKVTDAKGRPVKRTDLSAKAINSRFGPQAMPQVWSRSKAEKSPSAMNDWRIATPGSMDRSFGLDYPFWAAKAGLDTMAWYKFLYPGPNMYRFIHPIEPGTNEVAPFVVKDGRVQPIVAVYIDGEPVYYGWSRPTKAYAFKTSSFQYHRIEIRLADYGIKLDSVKIVPGYKTILSVDVDRPCYNMYVKKMTPEPLPAEEEAMNNHMMAYTAMPGPELQFLGQNGVYYQMERYGSNSFGPVYNGSTDFIVPEKYNYNFPYERNYLYEFGPNFVKMREAKNGFVPSSFGHKSTPSIHERYIPMDSIVARYNRNKKEFPGYKVGYHTHDYFQFGAKAILQLHYPSKEKPMPSWQPEYLALRNGKEEKFYNLKFNSSEIKVPEGKWEAFLVDRDLRGFKLDSLLFQRNGRNVYPIHLDLDKLEDSVWTKYQLPVVLNPDAQWSTIHQAPIGFRTSIYKSSSGNMRTLSGKIIEKESGEAVPFATIVALGFGIGAYSDADGNYAFQIPVETDTLIVTFLGYQRATKIYVGQGTMDFELEDLGVELSEIVVIGDRNYSSYDKVSASMVQVQGSRELSAMRISGGAKSRKGKEVGMLRGTRLGTVSDIDEGQAFLSNDVIDALPEPPAFPKELLDQLAGTSTLRSKFRDHAIWQPSLLTDKEGKASFEVTFPDDITSWDGMAIAVDRKGRTGLSQTLIKSWKPIAGRLAMPRFLYEGDSVAVIGKVTNYSGDSISARREFRIGDKLLQSSSGSQGPLALDTCWVQPIAGQDSFVLSYMAALPDGYGDGEQWGVRVFPQGVEEAEGMFLALATDTILEFPKEGRRSSEIKLRFHSSLKDFILVETKKLGNYQHLCNEQLASKLLALLAEKELFALMGKKWSGDEDVNKILAIYKERMPKYDAWGWWPGMPVEYWVSTHVSNALSKAEQLGYKIPFNFRANVELLKKNFRKENPYGNFSLAQYLLATDSAINLQNVIQSFDTTRYWSLPARVSIMAMRQSAGMSIDIDSLMRMSAKHTYGQRSWGYNANSYSYYRQPYQSDILATAEAYTILRKAGKSPKELQDILFFLLYQRNEYGWGNTYTTAKVLQAILPDISMATLKGGSQVKLIVDGQTVEFKADETVSFPATSDIRIEKSDSGYSFITMYQRYFEPKPERKDSLFSISTRFVGKGIKGNQLIAGEPVNLIVDVVMKEAGEYLMLEVPIPSSCSYYQKHQGYWYDGYAMYREYFREKTVMYFRSLHAGRYTFSISLLPRYSGQFTLNAARMENMYYPILAGQNEVGKVKVE